VYDQTSFSSPFVFPAWNTAAAGPGKYTILWEAENSTGCVQTLTTSFEVSDTLACQISPSNPDISPTNGKPSDQNKTLTWDVQNTSGKDLEVVEIDVSWTTVLGPHKLISIEWPDGTVVKSFSLLSPLTQILADFSLIPLLLLDGVGSGCSGSSCVRMSMTWDTQMINLAGLAETLTISYTFRDASGSRGTCSFSVKPTLSGK
jgi:hypothetical protein